MRCLSRITLAILTIFSICNAPAAEVRDEQAALHVLNRLGYGPRPGDVQMVTQMGVERYIDAQLHPEKIPMPAALTQKLAELRTRQMPAGQLLAQFRPGKGQDREEAKEAKREIAREVTEDDAVARLTRAIESPRQLEEVMVDFWFNHFNVFAGKGLDRVLVGDYEEKAIRPYALGHFRDLLGASAHHPAMLFYLDNWQSVAPDTEPIIGQGKGKAAKASGLNENYARELMELHTLGVDGGYSQKDVTELARILTGWTFDPREMIRGGTAFRFNGRRHDFGDKLWMGRHVAGRGQAEGEWALDVLASHPATARLISKELAQYFVADEPPPALVERLSHRFIETNGDIRAVLYTLFQSREFRDSAQVRSKFKTPYQFVVSAARAADVNVINVRPLLGVLYQLGMPLYGCQTPDGYKNTENAWLNAEAMTRRINFATALASGRLPLAKPSDADGAQGMGKRQLDRATQPDLRANARWETAPTDATALQTTLGGQLSAKTLQTVASATPALRAALILGSPDFMYR